MEHSLRRLRQVTAQLPHLHLWITLVLGLIFAVFFALVERRITHERRNELLSDIETARLEVQTRLRDTNEYFTLLGEDLLAENLSETAFQSRAAHFIDNHQEITAIGWISEEDGVNWISSRAVNNFDLGLQREEFKNAAGRARDQGDYAFSNFFRTFRGEKSFAVFVPIYKEDSFLGSFFGIYSLDRMIHASVPSWIDERYDISFIDKDELTLAREQASRSRDDDMVGISEYITSGFPVRIRLELYKQGIDWQSILVLALSLGVVVGVGLAIRELNNDRRLKKELAEQMREARDLAESANKTKSEFVANISHELRTPLTAILGYADLSLRAETPSDQVRNNLQNIALNGQNLLMLINDLLDHSKLEAGYLDIRKETFDLKTMLAEIFRAAEPQARAKDLGLSLSTEGCLPRFIKSDPLRFRQIVLNILANALKFTDQGKVHLQVRLEPNVAEPLRIALRVIDTGIGIAAHHHLKIFQTFSQADASISRQFGGTGLGLALARNLSHLLGGQLSLERSVLQEGSCFLFELPLSPSEIEQCQDPSKCFSMNELSLDSLKLTPPSDLPRLDGKRILLVEDSADLQQLLQEYLRRAGAKVVLVGDGESAIQLFLAFERFDAVLMDIQLPGADGYTTTEAIRRLGLADIPIVALTAHAGEQERDRSVRAGCNAYLAKPFAPDFLISTLKSCFPGALETSPPQPQRALPQPAASEDDLWSDPKLQQVRQQFIRGLPQRVQDMQAACELSHREHLGRLAHTLKGTAAHFGIPQLSKAAQDLELEIQSASGELVAPPEALLRIKTLTDHLTQGLAWAPEISPTRED